MDTDMENHEKHKAHERGYRQEDLNAVAAEMRKAAIAIFDDPESIRERARAAMVLAGHIEVAASRIGAEITEQDSEYNLMAAANTALRESIDAMGGAPENLIYEVRQLEDGHEKAHGAEMEAANTKTVLGYLKDMDAGMVARGEFNGLKPEEGIYQDGGVICVYLDELLNHLNERFGGGDQAGTPVPEGGAE